MSTISAGNTTTTAFKVTADTTGNLTLAPNTGARVILTGPIQYADGTSANTAASGGGLTWQAVVTSNTTVSSGNAYAVSTVSQPVIITLPSSPGAGNTVQLTDYANTWGSNVVTVNRNGSNISGSAANLTLGYNGATVVLTYIDTARGWLASNGYPIQPVGAYTATYLVVAGGGSGGCGRGGGGGAGGLLTSSATFTPGTAYTVTIGAGGAATSTSDTRGNSGANSSISNVASSIGGGAGGAYTANGLSGGSGGGGADPNYTGGAGTAGQGYAGGNGSGYAANGAGGGGAGAVGANVVSSTVAGNGGIGISSSISGSATYYAGGGGGGADGATTAGTGGNGGGGNGRAGGGTASSGAPNSGGGGGGAYYLASTSGAGASGIVVISYQGPQRGSGGTITTSGGYTIHTFTSSGTYTA